MSINDKIKYEVALSFAGEQRDYVRKVAEVLKDNNVDCYFDEFDEIELWGKYMPDRFQEVMGDKSKYAVIFISEEYKNKFYTNLERMTLLTSDLFREGRLLPAKFDDTKLPGLPDGINYVTLKDLSPEEFAKKIMRKIGTKTSKDVVENKVADFYIPKTRKSVNPITQRKEWIKYITQELKRRAVKVDGLEMDDDDEGSHHRILLHYNGKTLTCLNKNYKKQYRE